MLVQCSSIDETEEERLFLDVVTNGRSSHKRFLFASTLYSYLTMKSVAVLLLLSLISALFICCMFIDITEADAKVGHNLPVSKNSLDVNDDPTINESGENATPIIGILSQEVSNLVKRKYPDKNFLSYIAASYVKFVEGAGGRALPIWIGKSREYYEDILSRVNGVLLPGGATYFNQSHGYADAGHHIYNIAIEMNKRGSYMPIWGTCLGFELLVNLSANRTELRTQCASSSQALNLEFKEGYKTSRLFGNASDDVINILKNHRVTANFHQFCFTEKTFAENNMNELWSVLSLNHDWNGEEFISSIEHKRYPFYGVQFHPEKNIYEFVANRNITHLSKAIITSQYFANFFLGEARKNYNHFSNKTEERYSLIYNYNPEYTGAQGSSFEQQYLFEDQEYLYVRKNSAMRNNMPLLLIIGVLFLNAFGKW